MKHTPGPWQFNAAGYVGPSDIAGEERWKSGHDVIAQTIPIPYPYGYKRPRAENIANACLIAAAPEMLTELKFVRENIGHDSCTGDDPRPDICIACCVEKVIKKATGEQ